MTKFFLLVLLLLSVLGLGFAEDVHNHREEYLNVYASGLGTSLFNTLDYFEITKILKGEERDNGFLFLGKKYKLLTLNTKSGESNSISSVDIDEKINKEWSMAIRNNYKYDLEVAGHLSYVQFGQVVNNQSMIFLHKTFELYEENGKIKDVVIVPDVLSNIDPKTTVTFTYSFIKRTDENKVSAEKIEERNAFLMLFLLCVILMVVVWHFVFQPLKRTPIEDEDGVFSYAVFTRGASWKLLASEVFRRSNNGLFLCSLSGTGAHYLSYIFLSSLLCLKTCQSCNTANSYIFSCCYIAGGFVSAFLLMSNILQPLKRRNWVKCVLMTVLEVPIPFIALDIINIIRLYLCNILTAGDFRNVIVSILCYGIVGAPVALIGTLAGRFVFKQLKGKKGTHHVNQVPRIIPRSTNKLSPNTILLLSGFLPYVTLARIFNKFLSFVFLLEPFTGCSFCTATLLLYVVNTISVSILGTFTLLNMENHKWKWSSYGFGCFVSVYLIVHSIIFYMVNVHSINVLVALYYVYYVAAVVFFVGLVGGNISFFTATCFVEHIYGKNKNRVK